MAQALGKEWVPSVSTVKKFKLYQVLQREKKK